jgi:cytochrome b
MGAVRQIDAEPGERAVWDLPVRACHWILFLAVVGSYLTHQLGVTWFRYHVWCGYTVLVLVCFRLAWGVVGTRHARFRNFVHGPATALRYARGLLDGEATHFPGHNPLGAWMVALLLAGLLVQAVIGLFGNDQIYNYGPLAGYVTSTRSDEMTTLHRELFWWVAGAVALHIAAVIYHRGVHRENLVSAMLTGRKPADRVRVAEEIGSSRTLLALVIVVLLIAVLAWVVSNAPESP